MSEAPKRKTRELCPTAAWVNLTRYHNLIAASRSKAEARLARKKKK